MSQNLGEFPSNNETIPSQKVESKDETLTVSPLQESVNERRSLQKQLSEQSNKEIDKPTPGKLEETLTPTNTPTSSSQVQDTPTNLGDLNNLEKSVDKATSWFDNIGNTFDILGDIFETKGFMAGIKALPLFIKSLLGGGDIKDLQKLLDTQGAAETVSSLETTIQNKIDTHEKLMQDKNYIKGIQSLYALQDKKIIESKKNEYVLYTKEVSTLSYNDIQQELSTPKGIATRLKLSNISDEKTKEGLQVLIDSEPFLENSLHTKNPDWKKESIYKIISLFHENGGGMYHDLYNELAITEAGSDPYEIIKKSVGNMNKFLDIPNEEGGISSNKLLHRKESQDLLRQFTPETRQRIKLSDLNVTTHTQDNEAVQAIGAISDGKDTEIITKMMQFKNDLITNITQMFPEATHQENIKNFFNTHGFSYKELFNLFILTGGNPSIQNYEGPLQICFLVKLWNILGKDNTVRSDYDMFLFKTISDESNSLFKLHPEVKRFISNFFYMAFSKATDTVTDGLSEIWGIIKQADGSTQAMIIGTLGMFFIGSMIGGKIKFGIMSAATCAAFIYSKIGTSLAKKNISQQDIEHTLENYKPPVSPTH